MKTKTAENPLIQKLNPARFPGMSGKMAAIVGYILGESFTDPAIVEMQTTSDGFVLATQAGDCGLNDFIGAHSEVLANWRCLLDCAGLTKEERTEAENLFATRLHP